jgi:hypothetical protein
VINDTEQHSISYALSGDQTVIVEYEPDEETDMFQVILALRKPHYAAFTEHCSKCILQSEVWKLNCSVVLNSSNSTLKCKYNSLHGVTHSKDHCKYNSCTALLVFTSCCLVAASNSRCSPSSGFLYCQWPDGSRLVFLVTTPRCSLADGCQRFKRTYQLNHVGGGSVFVQNFGATLQHGTT